MINTMVHVLKDLDIRMKCSLVIVILVGDGGDDIDCQAKPDWPISLRCNCIT